VASFFFDDSGSPQIELVPDSRQVLEADTVIFAVGQRPDVPPGFSLDLSEKGLIELDPFTGNTSREAVFASGDAVSGTASVIKAIASGRKTAMIIDRFLGGDGDTGTPAASMSRPEDKINRQSGFAALERCAGGRVPPEERLKNFRPVETAIGESAAIAEAGRCLQCDLRLKIRKVKIWSEYPAEIGKKPDP
jgi:NADPH-dependent glutamate synthase beta subunit-like oxidoreductase